ncbi:protein-(glutamine-N5) methyltransferase, release factor-specific [Thermobacillus composti KWC4]|uniref:Release factor glutamine methyltransferase n=1 Tax=Thermobacillus composti (strain DSM 18247 / JCM 13945 / KWC4) TaxID=717605 RepID=L0EJR1_THECK|nr:peptide chain release factor N(5)-glutamine methyltransferase [Thermobacillus composti]AGA59899.1 protein-(glutamine-N5) methyltransferase, release factor-specific [Thermobacillus composti KWC4]
MADKRREAARFEPAEGLTIGEACLQASSFLAGCGVSEPRENAERLLMHALGLDRAALLRDWREPMPAGRLAEWAAMVGRKAAGEPVQYITGEQWFYGLPLAVSPAVLIPRPETELLVEAVLETADRLWPDAGGGARLRAADIGTGSGAIAVALAVQRPHWRLCATDLSPDALAVAKANAERHGVSDRIAFIRGDLLEPFAAGGGDGDDRALDIVVSNPPYIPSSDLPGLQREVRDYEPRLALDGGADGLDPYRRMAAQLRTLPSAPRIVAFEVGLGQARDVAGLLDATGLWPDIRIVRDYAGIERHVIASAP